jgi:hypothetical protein
VEKMLEAAARLHPKSLMMARMKTEKEYQTPKAAPG